MSPMAEFSLDPRLVAASEPLASLTLSEARLQNDGRFAWIVLVPRKPGVREIEHLAAKDRAVLMDEIIAAGVAARALGAALGRPVEKLNIGALGNIVEQLHIHVVGRRADDAAWPGPVWGSGAAVLYDDATLELARRTTLPAFDGLTRKKG